jgi:F0F1-type ATP synthase assembly protein I
MAQKSVFIVFKNYFSIAKMLIQLNFLVADVAQTICTWIFVQFVQRFSGRR